ncbi:MAG: hypothetical protein HC906_19555 [Bacteroidales bacterium]|nr:hypothetical protein [Bacteroidales bacterium]
MFHFLPSEQPKTNELTVTKISAPVQELNIKPTETSLLNEDFQISENPPAETLNNTAELSFLPMIILFLII